jgi:heme/copper-type cytochrome/quinol oxidase subunit 2
MIQIHWLCMQYQIFIIPLVFFVIIAALICYWSYFNKEDKHEPSDKIKRSDWYR